MFPVESLILYFNKISSILLNSFFYLNLSHNLNLIPIFISSSIKLIQLIIKFLIKILIEIKFRINL